MSYYDQFKSELQNILSQFAQSKEIFDALEGQYEERKKEIKKQKDIIVRLAKERQVGFPWLADAYDEFFKLQDQQIIDFLRYKKTPAIQASEIVKLYSQKRREAEKEKRIYKYLVEYYESIFPELADLKEEVADISEEDQYFMADYSQSELEDETTKFVTKEEFRKLSSIERNQLALERYWKRKKSKWLIGRIYERYVGYLYEMMGYDVDYVGIFKGYEDLGRDLICHKGNEIIVIQCKNWSQFKTIYEKHIFQFFGTVFQYKDENKDKNVKAIFYSATKLSDLAKRFGTELGIELKENFKMENNYACIKCNISRVNGTKIYHLPFDQQYDNVKIETNKGEFYCQTVKEAEDKGFRRAFKYKGLKQK